MNRVRLGLTGLALVFLIVVVAAVGRWPFGDESAPKSNEEMLATLGVAPGADNVAPKAAEPPAVLKTPPLNNPQVPTEPLIIDDAENLTEI